MARLIDQKRKYGEAKCVTEVCVRFWFWKALDRPLSRETNSILFVSQQEHVNILLITIVRFSFPVLPRYQSRERVSGYKSPRKCHEILVGPPSQSRRILHAPFIALSRIINRKIALIFSSLRFVKATAIAEASRSLISWKTRCKVVWSSARRVKWNELPLYFKRNDYEVMFCVIEDRSSSLQVL